MTKKEFESLLEEAFIKGYNDAIDEIFEEDASFDLEDEMDNYNEESGHYRNYLNKMHPPKKIDEKLKDDKDFHKWARGDKKFSDLKRIRFNHTKESMKKAYPWLNDHDFRHD